MTCLPHYWEHLSNNGILDRLLEDDCVDLLDWALDRLTGKIIPVGGHLYCVMATYAYHIAVYGDWSWDYEGQYRAMNRLLELLLEIESSEAQDCHCAIIEMLRWEIRSQEFEMERIKADYTEWRSIMNHRTMLAG